MIEAIVNIVNIVSYTIGMAIMLRIAFKSGYVKAGKFTYGWGPLKKSMRESVKPAEAIVVLLSDAEPAPEEGN
jgi:hypothetical protein